jgi:hypothetical protein
MSRSSVVAFLCATCLALAGVGYAATFTLTTKQLGSGRVTTPTMFPDSVTIADKPGGHVGKVENGDIITLVWSRQIDEPSLCSGWANTQPTPPTLTLQWSLTKGTSPADDTLTATGASPTCSSGLHIGSVDLGAAGYNTGTGTVNYATTSNALSVGASTTTLTVTLNGQSKGASLGTVTAGGAATWTPDSAITDRSGNNCGANLSMTSSTTQF